jgi:hypothetical protein
MYWIQALCLFFVFVLFNTTCFGLTGHHQAYKTIDKNYCSVFMLLYLITHFFFLLLPLWCIGLISQFLDHSQTVGLLGRVISSSQGLYQNTGQHEHRKMHTHIKHPCPEWDSNPRSRPPSERRQCMPQTARLPWPASYNTYKLQIIMDNLRYSSSSNSFRSSV